MEVEKKKGNGQVVVIILLLLMVLGLGGYICYDKFIKKDTKETTKKEKTTNTTLVSKLDTKADWVYDAEYKKDVTADYYDSGFSRYYAKDIVVPYINIKSDYADKSNDEIKEVFDKAIAKYNEGVQYKIFKIVDCSYQKNIYNNALSLMTIYSVAATDIPIPNYHIYNIDLKTGKELSFEDIYKLAGFDSKTIDSKVEESIKTHMKKYFSGAIDDTNINNTIKNYKDAVSNKTIKYFISGNGKLSIIIALNLNVHTDEIEEIIPIE